MRFVELFSNHLKTIYRCIAIAALLLIATIVVNHFVQFGFSFSIDFFVYLLIVLFITLNIIFPQKIEFLAIAAFIYSYKMLFTSTLDKNSEGFILYIAACSILFAKGFFRRNKWKKVILLSVIFAAFLLSEIRFGYIEFLKSLFAFLSYFFLLFVIILFYYLYLRNHGKSTLEKYINLSSYPDLSERDKEWLELVLKDTKYSTIAAEYNVTEGTVKNRMRYIYKVLQVSDRIGLMATFGGFTIKN